MVTIMPASDGSPFSAVPYASYTNFTPVLPAFYYDVYSSEQRIKAICLEIDKLINYADMLGININATHDDVAKLQQEFEQFKNNEMLDFYEKQLQKWIDTNMERLMREALLKFIVPGITEDGYFCIYKPDSWNDIQLEFGTDYGSNDYGCVILRF